MSAEKRRKTDDDDEADHAPCDNLKGFKIMKILSENPQQKSVSVHGRFDGSEAEAVLVLEKTQFNKESLPEFIAGDKTRLCLTMHNDIYKTYELYPPQEYNGIKSTLIYPATEKHIMKYSTQDVAIINETPEDYQSITLPFIESSAFSIQWVYNILEKKSEAERIVFEDCDPATGFILLPDMKWDGAQTSDLYLVALVLDRSVRSLRNLSGRHLELLENVKNKGAAVIEKKYGVTSDQLRVYVHYQPSYYHLHVHFTNLSFDAPGTYAGKAHLLDDIIDNIRLMSDYYMRKEMCYVLRKNDPLYERFREARRETSRQ